MGTTTQIVSGLGLTDVVAVSALAISFAALGWNIVRDLILDRVQLSFTAAFGECGNIKNSNTGVFADAGSLPNHKFDNPHMLISAVNTGRRPIVLSNVGGEYKNDGTSSGKQFSIVAAGLPKMLQPYEVFTSTGRARPDFIKQVQMNNVEKLWVQDSKGGKWELSSEGWERLTRTGTYLAGNQHI